MTLTHSSKIAFGAGRCLRRSFCQLGDYGSGSGKGGGSGGTIRDAGGAFGKLQAGREEEYFHRLEREQLKLLRLHYKNLCKEMEIELEEHENRAREHREAAERLKRQINEMQKEEKSLDKQ